ncbi:tRNA (adenosine(37)-N6)-threonylcarbamoyltransferase complex ATPase subunit type 1 TsaE [Candidatus Saccharibacteria bacterium]|nr:tRNA (adenosine(37)-N6)-threonylcarbamoyltransferase complex ATPase subunit type 1 TsaE [Candidatus Saccharibacteria bacterium]
MIIHSEQEMLEFAKNFAAAEPSQARVIELIGDVGAGKTTFVRGLAEGLGIKEPVTSPSFTISKTYALPTGGHFIHYDFYRLSDPGLMTEDLAENLANPENIIVVEWGESVNDILPENRTIINIKYNENGTREVIL